MKKGITRYSHSRVECYENCPFKFNLKYVQNLEALPDDSADNPLIIGSAMHQGVETSVKEAITQYYMSYPVITDAHIEEALKLEITIQKVKELIESKIKGKLTFEYKLQTRSFIGFIDLLEEVAPGYYKIYDFKYSNNVDHYLTSRQLHIYKYFFEKITGFKVIGLHLIIIPKIAIKMKKTEDQVSFRKRLISELSKVEPYITDEIEYSYQKVVEYFDLIDSIEHDCKVNKNENWMCARFCEFKDYCKSNGKIDWNIYRKGEN